MPLPITTRCSRLIGWVMAFPAALSGGASDARPGERRAPCHPPALLDEGQAGERREGEAREDQEAPLRAAGVVFGESQRRGEIEAADAARAADQPGHHADLVAKTLRHELKDRAIAGAQ